MTARHTQQRPRPGGFTLMEITIALVLLGMLAVVGTQMFAGSFFTTRMISSGHLAHSAARYAMERMAREIREAKQLEGTSCSTSSALSVTKKLFRNTTTPRGFSDTFTIKSSFNHAGTSLDMTQVDALNTSTNAVLARDVSALSFTCLDSAMVPTNLPGAARYLRINMTVTPAAPDPAEPLSLVTLVYLRNL